MRGCLRNWATNWCLWGHWFRRFLKVFFFSWWTLHWWVWLSNLLEFQKTLFKHYIIYFNRPRSFSSRACCMETQSLYSLNIYTPVPCKVYFRLRLRLHSHSAKIMIRGWWSSCRSVSCYLIQACWTSFNWNNLRFI